MAATILDELACTGHEEMSWFQGLSGGKTCSAARMASASDVSNETGRVTAGILGRGRRLEPWLDVSRDLSSPAALKAKRSARSEARVACFIDLSLSLHARYVHSTTSMTMHDTLSRELCSESRASAPRPSAQTCTS